MARPERRITPIGEQLLNWMSRVHRRVVKPGKGRQDGGYRPESTWPGCRPHLSRFGTKKSSGTKSTVPAAAIHAALSFERGLINPKLIRRITHEQGLSGLPNRCHPAARLVRNETLRLQTPPTPAASLRARHSSGEIRVTSTSRARDRKAPTVASFFDVCANGSQS